MLVPDSLRRVKKRLPAYLVRVKDVIINKGKWPRWFPPKHSELSENELTLHCDLCPGHLLFAPCPAQLRRVWAEAAREVDSSHAGHDVTSVVRERGRRVI